MSWAEARRCSLESAGEMGCLARRGSFSLRPPGLVTPPEIPSQPSAVGGYTTLPTFRSVAPDGGLFSLRPSSWIGYAS